MTEPVLRAEFELDEKGQPKIAARPGKRPHYSIRLTVDGAPQDTYAVTYQLDPSYNDPVREVRDRGGRFVEAVTSYGDYVIKANVRAKSGSTTVAALLSKALEQSYGGGGEIPGPVQSAIAQIKGN